MAGGRWPVAGGRWPVAGGRWPVAGGRWPVAGGRWPQRIGGRRGFAAEPAYGRVTVTIEKLFPGPYGQPRQVRPPAAVPQNRPQIDFPAASGP
ncbi:hypothetical protein DY245_16405 [Streptomyces inhibens]|uniref:Uncharacterized protein n=1 Tax=Streptomyces inhibens TaxID=2293571 RepID=A0A371Q3P0_STRIH|nr:hypothetical protein DY245_16405 [Streptomyces inhibens]